MKFTMIILILAGCFSMAGAGLNWDWFMENRRARFITTLLGHQGARIFYIILGLLLVVFGFLGLFGVLKD